MHSVRRVLVVCLFAAAAVAVASGAPAASGAKAGIVKPVIGKAVTTPAKATAGKRFAVTIRVTRSDTGGLLTKGTMVCNPTVGGKLIAHTDSFRGGVARLSFVVPLAAKTIRVTLTIRAGGQSATKIFSFAVVAAPKPSLTIGDASVVEGNAGTTTLSFPVTLSAASTQPVSVAYSTADGTAKAGSDYAQATGTVTFAPGEASKTIAVSVVGDTAIEPDETLTAAISSPVNATIARGTATGTIKNDDTTVPVAPGDYKGATQNGDYVYFTVLANRSIANFRVNNIKETCDPGGYISGAINWTGAPWPINADASFVAQTSWTGSETQGDIEWTSETSKVSGLFSGNSVSGTLNLSDELNYQGTHFKCSTGDKTWSATLQG
jgi:Calx-beta domain